MISIIHSEPHLFKEAVKYQVWKDAMIEEYESIMQNDIWEIVPRRQGKSVDFKVVVQNKTLHGR